MLNRLHTLTIVGGLVLAMATSAPAATLVVSEGTVYEGLTPEQCATTVECSATTPLPPNHAALNFNAIGSVWAVKSDAAGLVNYQILGTPVAGAFDVLGISTSEYFFVPEDEVNGYDGLTGTFVFNSGLFGPDPLTLDQSANASFALVPEPATLMLMGFGFLGLALAARRRN